MALLFIVFQKFYGFEGKWSLLLSIENRLPAGLYIKRLKMLDIP